jgi:hypothetical protein
VGVVVFAVLLGMLGAAPASGASWGSRELPVEERSDAPSGAPFTALYGVSCPSPSLCVAVGEDGAIASSTNPGGGTESWPIVRPYDLAVETDEKCYYAPPGVFPTQVPCSPRGRRLQAVSCPTASLCVAVSYVGYVYSSTDPSGPVTSWRVADTDGNEHDTHLTSISCPDAGFCVAVSGGQNTAGKVLTTTEPTGPGSGWRVTQLDPSLDLRAVSCTSRNFCLAVAKGGLVLRSNDPAGGASAWEAVGTPGGPGNLESVECVDRGSFLCLAGNSGGNFLRTGVSGAGGSTWSEANGGASVPITDISCPTASRCAAVDNNGDVLLSSDPGSGRPWSVTNLIPFTPATFNALPQNALFGVSCSSTDLCVLVGARGLVFTSVDPFSAGPGGAVGGKGKSDKREIVKRPKAFLVKADRFREWTRGRRLKVNFRFFAKSPVRGFVCKRDNGRYRRCRSPQRYWVSIGEHVLRVRAIGPTGLRGPVAKIDFEAVCHRHFGCAG